MTPGSARQQTHIAVSYGLTHADPVAPVVTTVELGFCCTKTAIAVADPKGVAGRAIRAVVRSLADRPDGMHTVCVEAPGMSHPLILLQGDRTAWYDRLFDPASGYVWRDMFFALGRAAARLAVCGDAEAMVIFHPSSSGWNYRATPAFLTGIGSELEIVDCRKFELVFHEGHIDHMVVSRALQMLRDEQRTVTASERRPLEVEVTDARDYDVPDGPWNITGMRVRLCEPDRERARGQ